MISAAPITFLHEIETPRPLRADGGRLRLAGWCVAAGQTSAPQLRLIAAGITFTVTSRIHRTDVVAALGLATSASNCGFVIEGKLPPGAFLALLEASCDGLTWQNVRQLAVVATPAELQAAVEWPSGPTVHESVRIQGWCAHPDFELTEVWLHYGNRRIRCEYGLPRTDVPGLIPSAPNAARSGFIAEKNLPAGFGPLRIRAVTSQGENLFIYPPVIVDITRDEENPAPLDLHGQFPDLGPRRMSAASSVVENQGSGATHRILFVLYGDFTSNSALHVSNLANALIAQGQECVVAVPDNAETIRYHPTARFQALSFEDYLKNPAVFKERGTADIVHAWTTRENVRQFCERIKASSTSRLVIHLEDHELRILEASVGRSLPGLLALPEAELDALVPGTLSHPHRSRVFLETADAVTLIIDRLRELTPANKPVHIIWPAADETIFFARPISRDMRSALGWSEEHTVLFYHGNVHATNAAEMRELYTALLLLNESGFPTTLIRTGRDFGDFLGEIGPRVAPYLVTLGQIDHQRYLPPLMALADFFVQPGEPDAFNNYRFPSKLPEFFAIGRPVILPRTNLGELLRHGEDAWILPKADAPSIAEAVRLLRKDAALSERLATGATKVAAKYFNWQRSAEALLAFYNSLPSRD